MSSKTVRTQFRDAWAVSGVPLVETINQEPTDLEIEVPIWATLTFFTEDSSHQTMGSSPWIEERGVVTVMLFSYSGIGDDDVLTAAEEVKKFWEMWISSGGDTWVTSIVGPIPPEPDAVGDVFRQSVALNYVHQYRGA